MKIAFLVIGGALLLGGILCAVRAQRVADWNDQKAPRWMREFNLAGRKPERGERSPTWTYVLTGIILAIGGIAMIGAGLFEL